MHSWTFSDLAVALMKYCDQPRVYKIVVQPEWSTNPQMDALLLSNTNRNFIFRISREEWDRFFEFSIAPNHSAFQRSYFRVDLLTGLPVQISKTSFATGLWANEPLPHDLQEFANEIFNVLKTVYQDYLIAMNRNNETRATTSQ